MSTQVAEPESSLSRSQQPVNETDHKSDKSHTCRKKRNTEGSKQMEKERQTAV